MKFIQLIEFNMINIFLEKPYTKYGRETILRPFSKISKLSISLDQYPKILHSLFSLHARLRATKYIETKLQTTCFYLILSFFNPHMHKMVPRRPKYYIFGNQFYPKNARRLRFHVFLHFNARKHMISSFYLKWTEFIRNCKFVPI